ncbi:hypothetical protein [Phyllobacterium sp. SB3]|uniref:hypothetical protein n=1 Tax=Phyllobacterium sp. SB3 TaxID=3156073 RepID=UPI0032AF7F88
MIELWVEECISYKSIYGIDYYSFDMSCHSEESTDVFPHVNSYDNVILSSPDTDVDIRFTQRSRDGSNILAGVSTRIKDVAESEYSLFHQVLNKCENWTARNFLINSNINISPIFFLKENNAFLLLNRSALTSAIAVISNRNFEIVLDNERVALAFCFKDVEFDRM